MTAITTLLGNVASAMVDGAAREALKAAGAALTEYTATTENELDDILVRECIGFARAKAEEYGLEVGQLDELADRAGGSDLDQRVEQNMKPERIQPPETTLACCNPDETEGPQQ